MPAELVLTVESASFSVVEGGQVSPQAFVVSSSGGDALRWSAISSVPWLTLNPSSGTTPTSVVASASIVGLAAGSYNGVITVAGDGATNSPRTITVSLTVTAAPRIVLSPTAVSLVTTTALPQVSPTTVQITSSGGGALAWTAATSASWITLNPPSGTAPATVSIGANATGLAAGNHSATVSITAAGASNSPQTIPVTLALAAAMQTITASASPAAGGTVSGAGAFPAGASVTLVATPASGYEFVNWTEGVTQVSTTPTYQFTASSSRTLTANFRAVVITITTSSNPASGGSTAGGGSYPAGATVTVVASPSTGYTFAGWAEGGVVVWGGTTYTFNATGNRNLVADFIVVGPTSYTIATSSNPAAGGTTSGGGNRASGASVTVSATAASGYSFTNWTEGASVVSTSASYTFTASANRSLVANFTTGAGSYTVATSSSPAAGGTTSGGGSYASGASVTVAAFPNSGFAFRNWTEGGVEVSTNATYTFVVTANRTLVANFMGAGSYTITTSSNPPAGGSTAGSGSYAAGASVTVTASSSVGYTFTSWTEGTTVASTSASYTFTASANRTLVANFNAPPTVTVTAPEDLDVARPDIAYAATCSDTGPGGCQSLTLVLREQGGRTRTLATGSASISGTSSLSDLDGQRVTLEFTGVDTQGARTLVERTIYVESSTSLDRVGTGGGALLDYSGGRTLWYAPRPGSITVAIRNVGGGDETIPVPGSEAPARAFLTAAGAVLIVADALTLYEWRNGTLRSTTNLNNGGLAVAGSYAVFMTGPFQLASGTLYRRDLVSGADIVIANAARSDHAVAENGDVAYWTADEYAVYRYRNGSIRLSNDTPDRFWNVRPLTDGINTVYSRRTPCCVNERSEIVLHDGSVATILSPSTPGVTDPGVSYAVRNGWTAFWRSSSPLGYVNERQIWTRAPSGVFQAVSPSAQTILIEELSTDGAVVFRNGTRRYLVEQGGMPRDVGSTLGRVIWRDGSFILLLGRTAWRIRR